MHGTVNKTTIVYLVISFFILMTTCLGLFWPSSGQLTET